MIESIRTHPYTRAVCLETARLFERGAARDLVKAQYWADQGAQDLAREHQARARLAQQRANAWHVRARNALPNLVLQRSGESAAPAGQATIQNRRSDHL
jgi:hypothetical protein